MAVPVLLAAACGNSTEVATESPSDEATSSASMSASVPGTAGALPACGSVWAADATLPGDYQGCDQDGQSVEPDPLSCSSGQVLLRYGDHFWAVRGGTIHRSAKPLATSPQYAADVAVCRG